MPALQVALISVSGWPVWSFHPSVTTPPKGRVVQSNPRAGRKAASPDPRTERSSFSRGLHRQRANGVLYAGPARLSAPYQRGPDVPTSQLDGGMSPAAPPRPQAPHLRRRRNGLHRSRSAGKRPARGTSAMLNARHHRRQLTAASTHARQQHACAERRLPS